ILHDLSPSTLGRKRCLNPVLLRELSSPQQSPSHFAFVLKKPSHKDRYDMSDEETN
uniref:Uncharacterized protein n=1 Tax=Calidris pygmaea TaxID=425635 RepID=A0A8C3PHE0_9CHAR